jgi:hypothetical protein
MDIICLYIELAKRAWNYTFRGRKIIEKMNTFCKSDFMSVLAQVSSLVKTGRRML